MDILDGITVICSSWWDQNEKKTIERIKKQPATNSRYKRFGHLAKFEDGFVLGKFVHNGKNSPL